MEIFMGIKFANPVTKYHFASTNFRAQLKNCQICKTWHQLKFVHLKYQCRLYGRYSHGYRTMFYDLHSQLLTLFTHQTFANQIHLESLFSCKGGILKEVYLWRIFAQKIIKKKNTSLNVVIFLYC